jgi:hypothetical protein
MKNLGEARKVIALLIVLDLLSIMLGRLTWVSVGLASHGLTERLARQM